MAMPNTNCKEIVLEQGTDEWLTARKSHVTATDIAPILGVSPYETTNYTLWADKLSDELVHKESKYLTAGHYLEPAVIDWVVDRLGITDVERGKCYVDGWKMASLDGEGMLNGEHVIIEAKTCGTTDEWFDEDGNETIPLHYQLQAQWQMIVTGLRCVIFTGFACMSREFFSRTCVYDSAMAEDIINEASLFHDALVNKTEPERMEQKYFNASEAERKKRAESMVEPKRVRINASVFDRWIDATDAMTKAKLELTNATNAILSAMGKASVACLDEELQYPCAKIVSNGKGSYLKKV